MTIIYTDRERKFGGFTKANWAGNNFKYDEEAFIFSVDLKSKYPIKGEKKYAIYSSPYSFATFGHPDNICIENPRV